MFKRSSILVLIITLTMFMTSCPNQLRLASIAQGVAQSAKARIMQVSVAEPDLNSLVDGNNEFAFDIYHQLSSEEGNLFYSPYSISICLAMTYAGARGETERQMADVMHFTLPQDRLHPAFNALDQAVMSRGKGATGQDGGPFRLNLCNSLWGQNGYIFVPDFLDVLAENYGSGIRLVDFASSPDGCRQIINEWVEEQTESKIKDLIPPGYIHRETILALVNAIYFNASWEYVFDEAETKDGPFYPIDDAPITVRMMNQESSFNYNADSQEGWEAIELPYDGNELSMVILLPGEGNFNSFQESLDFSKYKSIVLGFNQYRRTSVSIPKFQFESQFILTDTLKNMGMTDAFGNADFSGMDPSGQLFLDNVIHEAYLSVNEKGTEAAASTAALGIQSYGGPQFVADRPFIFLMRDIQTGSILFMGRVLNPLAGSTS